MGDELLKTRKLHLRTKTLEDIKDPAARKQEERRQGISKYKGERFDNLVIYALSQLKNNEDLIYKYEYIDYQGQSRTSANLIELRMLKILEIIAALEQNPERYISDDTPLDRNVRYAVGTGEIRQAGNSFGVKEKAKDLITYLWGKRKINYQNTRNIKPGRPLSIAGTLGNTDIKSKDRLANIVDHFNARARAEHISIRLKRNRTKNTIQLEVDDEFPASF